MRFNVDVRSDCCSYRGRGVKEKSIVLRAAWLLIVCVSCQVSEAPQDEAVTSSSQSVTTPPIAQVFEAAIAVRDKAVTALVGRLAEGRVPPPDLKIAFYDGAGDLVETVPAVTVQGTSSGLVYATPSELLTDAHQWRAIAASSAKVIAGPLTQPVYVGQARGNISEFVSSFGYDGCPDCLAYYLCHCLWELDGVAPPWWCYTFESIHHEQDSCELITRLKPVPRD